MHGSQFAVVHGGTSSMSASFQAPGPAKRLRPTVPSRLVITESQPGAMSWVVRHELPTCGSAERVPPLALSAQMHSRHHVALVGKQRAHAHRLAVRPCAGAAPVAHAERDGASRGIQSVAHNRVALLRTHLRMSQAC